MIKICRGKLPILTILLAIGNFSSAQSNSPEPRPPDRDLANAAVSREKGAAARAAFVEPSGKLSLRDALTAALANSPELAKFSWEIRSKEAELMQAGLRLNPEISAGVENFGGSDGVGGFDRSETTISLSQLIEFGGKRERRYSVAAHERNLAAWDFETARMELLTGTTKAFIEVLAAQEQLALAEELVQVAEEMLSSVSRRVGAGSTSPVEENRARVELEISRIDRDQEGRSLEAARKKLAAAWGGTGPLFSEAVGTIEDIPQAPPLDLLLREVGRNPILARSTAEIGYGRAALELERSLGTPDLLFGAGVRYFNETSHAAFVVEFGMPLPIFDRNQGASQAAACKVRLYEEERRAAVVRIQTELAVPHDALLAAESEVKALRDRALPEAESAFRSIQDAYRRGSIRFTDVLDTERLLFELKSRYFTALVRYHGAVADLERITGEPLKAAQENSGSSEP